MNTNTQNLPESWGLVRIKDLAELINGLWTGKKGPYIDVQVYSMTNFTKDCELDYDKQPRPIKANLKQYKSRTLKYGDILLEKSGGGPNQPVGRVVYFDIKNNQENTFSNFVARIRIRDKEIITGRFLHLYLKFLYLSGETEKYQKNSTNIRNLQTKEYVEIQIPLPPLPTQRAIVARLDAAFARIDRARTNLERNVANAKELFQAKLNEVFSRRGDGCEEKRLIDVSKFIDYRGKTPTKTESGIPLITAKNVRMGYLKKSPQEFISEGDYDSWMTRGIPQMGDVLFTTEAPLANVALLNTDDKIALAQRIITICPKRKILDGEYLVYCLQAKLIQDRILAKGTGATVTGIKSKLLKEIQIPLFSLEEQRRIVVELSAFRLRVDLLRSRYSTRLQDVAELKQSLLQKAFRGELITEADPETVADHA